MQELSKEYRVKFAKAAKSNSPQGVYKTQEEWEKRGVLIFKRRVLGLCGDQTVKSLDELTGILIKMSVIDHPEEGRDFINNLYERKMEYETGMLEFERVQDKKGQKFCRINKYYN